MWRTITRAHSGRIAAGLCATSLAAGYFAYNLDGAEKHRHGEIMRLGAKMVISLTELIHEAGLIGKNGIQQCARQPGLNKVYMDVPVDDLAAPITQNWIPPTRSDMTRMLKNEIEPKSVVGRAGNGIEGKANEFDLLIIGGGATGCGTAVDAATRGLKVALIERDDFASGMCQVRDSFCIKLAEHLIALLLNI